MTANGWEAERLLAGPHRQKADFRPCAVRATAWRLKDRFKAKDRRSEAAFGYRRAATRYALPRLSQPVGTLRQQRVSKPVANQCH